MISQGEGDDHNMINLLDDSASDSQEILKLPPLKSKRSKLFGKKKKPHFEEPPSCIPCKPIKYFFATLAIATLIAVSLVTFVLMQQISNLKKEFQAAKLDSQNRTNVDFKPIKRMKKRRELDALVGNGKLRRKCRGSGQELLRPNSGGDDDSESSETEFTVPTQKAIIRKRSRSNVCTTCLTVSGFLVLVACLVACGTLLWMHFALRKNLDYFQKKLETVERKNQFTPEEFQRLHTQIQELNKTLNYYKSGKNGLQAILQNVTLLSKEVANLKVTSASLQSSLAKAPSLQSLPAEVNAMSNSLKSQGSDLESFKTKVLNQFKNDATNFENLTKSVIELKSDMKQLQTEEKQANNTEINFTKFQKHLNSTESKLQDQIFQLQKQFQMFEFQFNETAIAPTKQTTKQAAESTTYSTIPSTKKV